MLVKCVCTNCSHSYLADDQAGELACPRCGVSNEGTRNPSDIPDLPGYDPQENYGGGAGGGGGGGDDDYGQPYDEYIGEEDFGYQEEAQFDPQAPPPMVITNDRLVRGLVFGALATGLMGVVLGASLAAIRVAVPAALALTLPWVAAAGCRYGFGGRASLRTKGRAMAVLVLVVVTGFTGFFVGSWGVERFTGDRADQARKELDQGLRTLKIEHTRTSDVGAAVMLDQRIKDTQDLLTRSNAELEDYLWIQEAQVNQPVLAYARLRLTHGPLLRFGPDADAIEVPEMTTAAVLLLELIVAIVLGLRSLVARR